MVALQSISENCSVNLLFHYRNKCKAIVTAKIGHIIGCRNWEKVLVTAEFGHIQGCWNWVNIWRSAAKFRPSKDLADTFGLKLSHFSNSQIFSNANRRTGGIPVAAKHNPHLGNFRCNASVYCNTWGVKEPLIRVGYVKIWKKIMLAMHLEDCLPAPHLGYCWHHRVEFYECGFIYSRSIKPMSMISSKIVCNYRVQFNYTFLDAIWYAQMY